MTVLFDTSVLLPALLVKHEQHAKAWAYVEAAMERHVVAVSTHALAELYAQLTGYGKLSPAEARMIVRRVEREFIVQPLALYDYTETLDRAASRGIAGGGIYDALHVRAAEKVGAGRIVHGDRRSYPHLWPASKLQTPLAP
jgi:predicted nucleic acid-binding protein